MIMIRTKSFVMVFGMLLLVSVAVPHAVAELTQEQAVEKVAEGAKHFREALKEDASKDEKKQSLKKMYAAFTTAFREKKHDTAVAEKIEEEANKVSDAEDRALFCYFVCDSYHQLKRLSKALHYINKALVLDDKDHYKKKKKKIEEDMKK